MSTDLSIILTAQKHIAYRPLNTVGNYANGCRQDHSIKLSNNYSQTVHFRFLGKNIKVETGGVHTESVGDATIGPHEIEADLSEKSNPMGQFYVANPDNPGLISGTTQNTIQSGSQLTVAVENGQTGLFFRPNQFLSVKGTQVVNAIVEQSEMTFINNTATNPIYIWWQDTLLLSVSSSQPSTVNTPDQMRPGTHKITVTDADSGQIELASGELVILGLPPNPDETDPKGY